MRVRKPITLIVYLVVYGGGGLAFCLLLLCSAVLTLIDGPGIRTIPDNPDEAWQSIIKERRRREADLISQYSRLDESSRDYVEDFSDVSSQWNQMEIDFQILIDRTVAKHGKPPPEIKEQLESQGRPMFDFGTALNAHPSRGPLQLKFGRSRMPDEMARQQAEREAPPQQERAQPQPAAPAMPQYAPMPVLDPQVEQRAREQQVRDQQAERERDQREREQQLREQERQRAQAAANPQGPPNGSSANQPPPGIPVTDLSQIKPRDIVLVRADDQWVEALVQLKRGKLIQVRAFNGNVAMVTIDRIRLKVEPAAPAENTLPPALRGAGNSVAGNKSEEEVDGSLFVAKPSEAGAENPLPPPPAGTGKKPAARAAEYRTWTDDTGTFQVEAELLSFEFDLVQLRRRSDGKVLSLRIEKLSAADQQIVRERFP